MRARLLPLSVVALAAWLSAGCITSETLLKVKPNGSGTMEMTMLVNTEVFKELGQMTGGEGATKSKGSMPTPEDLTKELSTMKGVRLVSQTPIKRDGLEGAKVVMAFDDINEITVSEDLPGKQIKPKPEDEVKFALTKLPGGHSLLSVQFPDKPGEAAAKASATQNQPRQNQPRDRASEKMDPEMMKMMAGFFKGMRVTIAIDVDGTLVKSSSPYVEGNRVTLLDIDFGQLMADPAALEKVEALPFGPDMSISEGRAALEKAGIKGIKINDPKVTVEFR